jgi:hypothetical protein
MRTILVASTILALAAAGVAVAQGTASQHVMVEGKELKWGPPPPVLEQNAKFTVVSGDPGKAGLYVVRLDMPAGYKIMPHWHPTDEHVTVLSGSFSLGMGDKFEPSTMKTLPQNGYALLPAEMRHYAMAKSRAVVQVHGMGPFQLTYVNPGDDPSQRASGKK